MGKFEAKGANLLDDLLKIGQSLSEFKGFHTSISMLDDILAYEIDEEKIRNYEIYYSFVSFACRLSGKS